MRGSGLTPGGDGTPDHLDIAADAEGVAAAADWAEAWGRAESYDAEAVFAMRLCIEEAITNIIFYAYPHGERHRWVRLRTARTPEGVNFEVSDGGCPFDAAHARDPGVENDIGSATVGGRGIRLMRAFCQELSYERAAGENRLTFAFLRDRRASDR